MDWNAYQTYWTQKGFPAAHGVGAQFERLLAKQKAPYDRIHVDPGHWTASAFVWDPNKQALLMMHHKKIEKWLQPGGHADGDTDLVSVARKECEEETGVSVGNPVHWQETNILDIDIHEIPPRKGEPAHLHFDVRYLFLRSTEAVPRKNSESNAVKWVDCTDLESITSEESILRPVRKILQGGWR